MHFSFIGLRHRPFTIQPKVCELPPPHIFGFAASDAQNAPNMSYTYWLSIPKSDIITDIKCASDVLQSKSTSDLLRLLLKNEPSLTARNGINDILYGNANSVPMMASALAAQTLGFFAYRNVNIEVATGDSTRCHLLTLQTKDLLNGVAPFVNPLENYWLADVQQICEMLDQGTATLNVVDYTMTCRQSGASLSQSDIIQANKVAKLARDAEAKRKTLETYEGLVKRCKTDLAQAEKDLQDAISVKTGKDNNVHKQDTPESASKTKGRADPLVQEFACEPSLPTTGSQ